MEDIKELINIINKRKLSQIEVFDKSLISRKDTLFSKLYNNIANENIRTDLQAMVLLYGNEKDNSKYRKLKSRFKTRLLNTLYFLDINNNSSTNLAKKEYADCLNKLYLSNLLLRYAENRNISIKLILDNYQIAKKNNFYDILKEFSFKLLVHYGMTGNEKAYEAEKKAYDTYVLEYENEQAAQIIYSKIYLLSHSLKKNQSEKLQEIEIELKKYEAILKKSNSLLVFFFLIRSNLFYFETKRDNKKINLICDKFIAEYNQYQSSLFKYEYLNNVYLYKLKSLFDSRQYTETLQLANQMSTESKFGLNLLSMNEYILKTYLNLKETEKAKIFIHEVLHSSAYKHTTKLVKERWLLFDAYVYFIYSYAKNEPFKFSTAKLYNQIPNLVQDKFGLNLSIRIIEILFLIGKNDLDEAITKIENLASYQNRYFKESIYHRSNLFIKLLQIMEKKSFNYKSLKYLKEHTLLKENFDNQIINDNEIIFFDQLWEIILDVIERNDRKLLGRF
ncbi:MAG TPA: hypothetical protein PK431_10435 [Chitinophagales bacterium]|nr:hypothetical protein [Chitinophagales bacterium]